MLMQAVQSALSAAQQYAALNNAHNSTNNKLYKILLTAAMTHFKQNCNSVPSSVSPFLTEELLSSMLMTRPPSRCIAAEKLQLVRVLTS